MSKLPELTDEQNKIVKYSPRAIGPTLVKGGPGTGKTTMALYRVKEMLEAMRLTGLFSPRYYMLPTPKPWQLMPDKFYWNY